MRKYLLLIGFIFLYNSVVAQLYIPPCYGPPKQECTSWSSWVSTGYSGYYPPPNNLCKWTCLVWSRYCLTEPNLNEIYMVWYGFTYGPDCIGVETTYPPGSHAAQSFVKRMIYDSVVYQLTNWKAENIPGWKTIHNCNGGTPEMFHYWTPGSCTHFCTFENVNDPSIVRTYEYDCSTNWCCGALYYACWDDVTQKIIINKVSTNDESTGLCNNPVGQEPWYINCPSAPGGFIQTFNTECKAACDYTNY